MKNLSVATIEEKPRDQADDGADDEEEDEGGEGDAETSGGVIPPGGTDDAENEKADAARREHEAETRRVMGRTIADTSAALDAAAGSRAKFAAQSKKGRELSTKQSIEESMALEHRLGKVPHLIRSIHDRKEIDSESVRVAVEWIENVGGVDKLQSRKHRANVAPTEENESDRLYVGPFLGDSPTLSQIGPKWSVSRAGGSVDRSRSRLVYLRPSSSFLVTYVDIQSYPSAQVAALGGILVGCALSRRTHCRSLVGGYMATRLYLSMRIWHTHAVRFMQLRRKPFAAF